MARVEGLGGFFLYARDPKRLADWYATHLGLALRHNPADGAYVHEFAQPDPADPSRTVPFTWAIFPGRAAPPGAAGGFMLSYRVDDLDALLDRLAVAGVRVEMSEEFEDG